ncbi:dihydroxyacetone kinase subunit DhaL [Paenibacillus thalictri]|uniref:phosphoenolpyruvate--glycerone phosphotransferase n=1 Tax=Paenibacillus thalictri TaxID=2527873 RepID=A0A4Q9DVQ5_9BACL|nr:dihydroxyacetone kinase subunit DhaL [Paenibacillus thalictri]TBL81134.1 dihydroxyacetone kinase subunit L [Paenibacillus thalictri]
MVVQPHEWKQILLKIGQRVEEEKDYLSDLDRVIGDGDHGVSMAIGWTAIKDKLQELENENDLGTICQSVAKAFLNAVGASVGPLYGTAFLRGSQILKGKTTLTEEEIVKFWSAAVAGMQQMGKAEVGDKTMMDTWVPIAAALEHSLRNGEQWPAALDRAVEAGRKGMESTRDMVSNKGRSGRLGDRSKGHIDPGAASALIIFTAFADACKEFH